MCDGVVITLDILTIALLQLVNKVSRRSIHSRTYPRLVSRNKSGKLSRTSERIIETKNRNNVDATRSALTGGRPGCFSPNGKKETLCTGSLNNRHLFNPFDKDNGSLDTVSQSSWSADVHHDEAKNAD